MSKKMDLFVAVPSYRGISKEQAEGNCGREKLVASGHSMTLAVLKDLALIDLVRAELIAMFLGRTKCEAILCIDDDVSIDPDSLLEMIALLDPSKGQEVISAPVKMRSEGNLYNICPTSLPDDKFLAECSWTGLGAVLMTRRVFTDLYRCNQRLRFESQLSPGVTACGLFNSIIVDADEFGGAPGAGLYLGDDRAFSYRLHEAGNTIYAYVKAKTKHRDLHGCMFDDMTAVAKEGSKLVGPNGDPL